MTGKQHQERPGGTLRSTHRSLPIALLRARETLMEPLREMLSDSQISEQKWRVLRVVEEDGPIEQTMIAERACLLLPSLTRILRAMETDGLLLRQTGTEDRRKSFVSISDKGRMLIQRHIAKSNDLFAELERKFGREDMNQLLDLLEKLQKIRL
ncbi:homoprotocatechuate degradation operon regulator HpaR [Roseobacter sp. YSTF-M11]|uniref:Homoprotocatechuate degradation operon regulator HpaR n=1 Tax=Roseobacter insulae TaxID=2859783 RepID=A0A9X1FYE1_9RHOB|nr:homoprotocatechuate degradation operon regulator HpaR [Roseobacter insulae]MBW4709971.1 homoprotocatechuate degradation operon regulator HpaR [Roseobacter insulae]